MQFRISSKKKFNFIFQSHSFRQSKAILSAPLSRWITPPPTKRWFTIENGELELEVKKTKGKGVKDRQLKWTVEDSSVLAFEDMDDGIYDDEMEFVGIKPGKTTVTCTNTANKEKVTFTITVK